MKSIGIYTSLCIDSIGDICMITSIRLKRSTKALLDEIGNKGQTYDDVVVMLANDFVEARK